MQEGKQGRRGALVVVVVGRGVARREGGRRWYSYKGNYMESEKGRVGRKRGGD